jgi:hypothetical protein
VDGKEVGMSLAKVRFLHTSDWRLESPMGGVTETPAELREPFQDAPYQAVERVIQAAIDQKVDFVLATGDLLSLDSACPYTLDFLLRQWDRLGEQGIAFYWLGGRADDLDLWPAPLKLPAHVHCFAGGDVQALEYRRDGKLLARLLGRSDHKATWRATDYAGEEESSLRIAAVYGEVSKRGLENNGVDYWALGGRGCYEVLLSGKQAAAYAGSPQGHGPAECGPHGAVLVEYQPGRCDLRLLETDLWRWRHETVDASGCGTLDALQSQMVRVLSTLPPDSGSRHGWLFGWTITQACDLLLRQLEADGASERLSRTLNQQASSDHRWTLAIDWQAADLPAELWDEDSILGDFLRTVRRLEEDPDGWRSLLDYVPESEDRQRVLLGLSRELQEASVDGRRQMWRQVANWGAELLRGESPLDLDAQE